MFGKRSRPSHNKYIWLIGVLTHPGSNANMGPTWGRQDPGWPHVGPVNLTIWVSNAKGQEDTLHLQRLLSLAETLISHRKEMLSGIRIRLYECCSRHEQLCNHYKSECICPAEVLLPTIEYQYGNYYMCWLFMLLYVCVCVCVCGYGWVWVCNWKWEVQWYVL